MSARRWRPRVHALAGSPALPGVLARLARRHGVVALDSAGGRPRRFSLVAFDPLRDLALPGTLDGLRAFHAQLDGGGADEVPGPFQGGFVGALSYDLGVHGERRVWAAEDPWRSPRIAGGLYTDFVVLDGATGRAWLVLGDGVDDGRPSAARRREELLAALAAPEPALEEPVAIGPAVRHVPPAEHRARVERLRARIAAGDLYQANLAHRITREVRGDPLALYLRLRDVNPAPYMAYLAFDAAACARGAGFPRGALLSASPELLLEFDGRTARTRPIKGTAARGADPAEDDARAVELLRSEKDRAELAMIVDLARNDLGRHATAGGVRVEAFPRLETYATVHHLVADVAASVRAGVDAFDLLGALFPGGSITGAPKLASMAAIADLEGEGRGFFTGSLGFVDTRGHAAFNILIRTLVWRPAPCGGEVSFHVGGGITWSSVADAEERETLHKGAGLLAALERSPQRA